MKYDFFKDFNLYLCDQNYSVEDVMKVFKNLFIQFIVNLINLTKFEDETFSKLNISKTKAFKSDDDYNTTKDFRYCVKEILENFIENYGFNFIFEDILFPNGRLYEDLGTTHEIIYKANTFYLLNSVLYNYFLFCIFILFLFFSVIKLMCGKPLFSRI